MSKQKKEAQVMRATHTGEISDGRVCLLRQTTHYWIEFAGEKWCKDTGYPYAQNTMLCPGFYTPTLNLSTVRPRTREELTAEVQNDIFRTKLYLAKLSAERVEAEHKEAEENAKLWKLVDELVVLHSQGKG